MSAIWVPMFSMQNNIKHIIRAAEVGDLATVQRLDPGGTNPVQTSGKYLGYTPIHIAAAKIT